MARVNAYLKAGNDNGRQISVGGRGSSNSVWATLNTDNAEQSDCSVSVRAEVMGLGLRAKERRIKSIGDDRISLFRVELPKPGGCTVVLETEGARMRELVAIGGMLCAAKGVQQIVSGEPEKGIRTIDQARQLVAECEAEANKDFRHVILPGGVTLARALACVEVVERIERDGGSLS